MRRAALIAIVAVGFAELGCGSTTRSGPDEPADTNSTGAGGTATVSNTGLPAPWLACQDSTDCAATFAACCDHCTEASLENSVAIAKSSAAAYRDSVCAGAASCPRCVSIPNPYLQAICSEGSCTLVDLSTLPLVSCTESSECKLRAATCCECDPLAQWISINRASETAYADLVCAPEANCPECSIEVTDIDPGCHEGRCVVRAFGL